MSCINDAEKAILDDAFKFAIDGRMTFQRVNKNQFIVSNGAKAKTKAQAVAIARETIKRISQRYNGHVVGNIHQVDEFSPLTVTLKVNPNYSQFIYNTQLKSAEKDFSGQLLFPAQIKPGVEDLFESNPELANAVYEAAGIGKFRVTLGKELDPEQKFGSQGEPIVKKFEVLDENKKIIGTVTLDIAKKGAITAHPKLTTIGRGYGQELYQIISLTFGAPVIEWGPHNISKSLEGKKLWSSLEKKGLAKAKYQWDDDIYLRGIDLSQQKQQAQQLYSQYLDTIFPDSKVKDIVYHGSEKAKEIKNSKFLTKKDIGYFKQDPQTDNGIYFSVNEIEAATYANISTQEEYQNNKNKVLKALLNINSPKEFSSYYTDIDALEDTIDKKLTKEEKQEYIDSGEGIEFAGAINDKYLNKLRKEGYDAVIESGREYVVFEPEQIHILGSKQDVEGFKKFVKTTNESSPKYLLALSPEEQDQNNANTGPNTNADLNPDQYASPAIGHLKEFIIHKRQILSKLETALREVNRKLDQKNLSPAEREDLRKERKKLKKDIDGVPELGIKGLREQIEDLADPNNSTAIGYYVEKDLQRLDKLAHSDSIEDLDEATKIINFYDLAGTFESGIVNPFFDESEMFILNDAGKPTTYYSISQEDIDQFVQWKNRAISLKNVVTAKRREIAARIVNENIQVKTTYGESKNFSVEDLTYKNKGLRDASWVDKYVMDITSGIFSQNGITPQVIFSELTSSVTTNKKFAEHFEERVNKLNPTVLDKLKKLNQTLASKGVDGITQGIYSIFLERNRNNQLTGGYAHKFNSDFMEEKVRADVAFSRDFAKARILTDYETRRKAFYQAFKKRRDWHRANTIVIEFHKLPEIINDTNFSEYSSHFDFTNAESYKNYLVNIIGEKEYAKQVEEQKRLLQKYASEKTDTLETLMEVQGITNPDELSQENELAMERWVQSNSPFHGITDYYSVHAVDDVVSGNFYKFNSFIPRKTKSVWNISEDKKSYLVQDSDVPVSHNYYNTDFEKYIETDEDLYAFHNLLAEAMDYIKKVAPADLANKLAFNYLSTLDKTSSEIITNNNTTNNFLLRIIPAFKQMWENIRLSFGVNKQSEISMEHLDLRTGKPNYKINDSFIKNNQKPIEDKIAIEGIKFIQTYNVGNTSPVAQMTRYLTKNIKTFNEASLIMLRDYLGLSDTVSVDDIRNGRLQAIIDRTGENVQIAKVIMDYAVHETVKEQSFDLAKIIKHFTNLAALYSARSQAVPKMNLLKEMYESIEVPKTNNIDKPIFNLPRGKNISEGTRTRAIAQVNNWWERVVLDNQGDKHMGVIGSDDKKALIGKTIYSKAERAKFNEIEKLLNNDTRSLEEMEKRMKEIDEGILNSGGSSIPLIREKISLRDAIKLKKIQDSLGKTRTATAALNNLLNWVRTMRLGWNLNSSITNLVEGWVSNMVLASGGEYFDPNHIYYGYHVAKASFVKNIAFGKAGSALANKNRMFMDMFDVLMDSKNELQKSSVKTFSNKFEKFNPHALNQRVEYINQSVLMVAMLKSQKIKAKDGSESSVWDAMTLNRTLKEEFRTEENIKNWEDLTGKEYQVFREKLRKVIVLGHGNYDDLRGMLAKSSTLGKATLMFKTWLPQQIYWRFGVEQDDILSGTQGFKGKYFSYGAGSGSLHLTTIATLAMGPVAGIPLGIAGGIAWSKTKGKDLGLRSGDDSVGLAKETATSALVLVKKLIGMPLNSIAGRKIIDTSGKEFDTWIGKGDFTKQDANALKANMADLAMQLTWLAIMLITKAMFWDDDDEEDSPQRIAHNIIVNKTMQLSSQAGMYINPKDLYKSTVGTMPVVQYLSDVGETLYAVNEALHGHDEIGSGINAGESKLWNTFKDISVPGMIKDIPYFGFEKMSQRQFQVSPFDKYFKLYIRENRKKLKEELTKKGYSNAEINKELNRVLPTKKRLQKNGMTRGEWLKTYAPDK